MQDEATRERGGGQHDGDPAGHTSIRLELFRNQLDSIANEMAITLQRAAYSTNVKTRLDFSCAIFDASQRMIAQSFSIPIHLGSLVHYVPNIVRDYGLDRLRPGDVLVCNDGHRGGVHLNDVCVLAPVYAPTGLAGFVATLAHHVDVGGATPGSIGPAREIYQEGLIIPPIRLADADGFCADALNLILNNVRSKRETGGDLRAQVAGVNRGSRRVIELVDRVGWDGWHAQVDELLDYTERRARHALRQLPVGTYEAQGWLDDDGITDEPVRVRVKISVTGSKVIFDLTGSDQQRWCPVNCTYAMTVSNCAYALRCLLDPDLPTNDGFYRVLEVIAEPGSIVNAKHPAGISSGWELGFRVCETALQAFAQAVPERVTAGSKGCLCNVMFGGIDPRTGAYFAYFDSLAGGYGARYTKDGIDAIQPHVQNTENAPIEETEANYPVRIVRYELIPDSGGPGRYAGGLGLRRDYTFEDEVTFSVMADRAKFAPWGLHGGGDGRRARYIRNPGPDEEVLGSKFSLRLLPGEVVSVQMGGGGGFGPPAERQLEAVLKDVRNGKISVRHAREAYGVDASGEDPDGEPASGEEGAA